MTISKFEGKNSQEYHHVLKHVLWDHKNTTQPLPGLKLKCRDCESNTLQNKEPVVATDSGKDLPTLITYT